MFIPITYGSTQGNNHLVNLLHFYETDWVRHSIYCPPKSSQSNLRIVIAFQAFGTSIFNAISQMHNNSGKVTKGPLEKKRLRAYLSCIPVLLYFTRTRGLRADLGGEKGLGILTFLCSRQSHPFAHHLSIIRKVK